MEAEYMAASHATTQALWLTTFLSELGFPPPRPITIHVDNAAAPDFANEHMTSQRSKHIDIRHHFIRDAIQNGYVTTEYVPSRDNLADLLTKALTAPTHWDLTCRIGMNTELRGSVEKDKPAATPH